MTTPDWAELTRFAIALAEASAEAILPYFRQNTHVEVKDGPVWDPVTEGDRAGERAIRALIEAQYPDHGILGEEYGVKEGRSPFTWVLDPVDGTRSFVCGMPTWATLIGLSFEGKPALGLMNQPVVGDMFYGSPQGAWHDYRGHTTADRTRKGVPLAAPRSAPRRPNSTAVRRTSAASRRSRPGRNSPAMAGTLISSA